MAQNPLPDFAALKARFDERLTPGQRAEIRRARAPDDLAMIPGYYRILPEGCTPTRQWERVVFLLPHAGHREGAGNIGQALAGANLSEMRVFQLVRSNSEALAMRHLRRLCRHVKATVDWEQFGRSLYFWGPRSRQEIAEDYFAAGGGKHAPRQRKENQ